MEDFLKQQFNMQNVAVKKPYTISVTNKPVTTNEFENKIPQNFNVDKKLYDSALGTPVFSDITFQSGSYTDNYGATKNFPELQFQTVILIVSQTKNIIKTPIQGRDGTVKEYVGMGDYEITINGIITGANGHYPIDEVTKLKQMLIANIPIKATATWLQLWDIDNIVIEGYDIPQIPGGYSYQPFSIKALSDFPIEIEVLNV